MEKNNGESDGHCGLSTATAAAAYSLKNKFYASLQRLKSLLNKSKSIPTEVQLCLLICRIFPDDSRIPIDDLVMYMIGLKLLEDVEDMFAARCRVNDLISIINGLKYLRNGVSDKIKLTRDKDGTNDEFVKFLVGARELAMLIPLSCPLVFDLQTIQEKWLESKSYGDFYGLSLVLKKINDYPIHLDYPKLALLQLQYGEDSKVIPVDFFKRMEELCVLSMDIPFLPPSLYVPRSLTTLRIKVIKLEQTSWIGGLTNLEFLSVSTSSLTDIPREMGNLEKLRSLDLKKVNLAYIPPGLFSRMSKLEELYLPLNFGRWGCKKIQHADCDEWEFEEEDGEDKISTISNEIDDDEKVNASLNDIVSPSLNALHISISNASVLPKRSLIFKNIRQFKVHLPNYVKHQPVRKDMSNELHLTGEACDIKESGICDLISRTEEMRLIRVKNLKNATYLVENSDLALLKKMIISECEELECVVEAAQKHILPEDNCSFMNLESLHLSMLYSLKELCNDRWGTSQWFSNLRHLSIRFCHKLKYVFSLSHFSRRILLKDIQILDCNEMEGVFYEGEQADAPHMLDCIEYLDLHSLPKLIGFSIAKDNRVDGVHDEADHSLTTNENISSCKEMSTYTFHGNIKSLGEKESISSSSLIDEEHIFQVSTNVKLQLGDTQQLSSQQVPFIKNKDNLIRPMAMYHVVSSRLAGKGLRNLRRLKIAFCDSISIIFLFDKNHAITKAFISLEELELYGLRNLVHIWFQMPPKTSAFQNLQLLVLSECNNTYLFSPQIAKLIVQLQKVYVSRCEKMKEIIVKGDDKLAKVSVLFPKLEHLELQYMPNLKIFSRGIFKVGFPKLNSLKFNQCNKMESFSTGDAWMPKLERIEINGSLYSLMDDLNATIMICMGTWIAHNFTFADLKKATEDFRPDRLLGQGSSGKVYEGWLHEKTYAPSESGVGMVVAIKRLSPRGTRGFEEWQSEAYFLQRLWHPNVIKLLGYCREDGEFLLVFEFMERGSLHDHLFTRKAGIEPLSWELRLKVAIGAARGLALLHSLENKIVHRDFKPSNILIDANYNAKVSDFGLAKLWPSDGDWDVTAKIMETHAYAATDEPSYEDYTHISTRVAGTLGYMAPEYALTGHLTEKVDVFSFGVVLSEIISGKRNYDHRSEEEFMTIYDQARHLQEKQGELSELVDPSLETNYSKEEAERMLTLALLCTTKNPSLRPSMSAVVEMLEGKIPIVAPIIDGSQSFSSQDSQL